MTHATDDVSDRLRSEAALLCILLLVAGCGTDPPDPGASCRSDSDCPKAKYCGDDGYCSQDCEPAGDPACESDEICTTRGRCVADDCNSDADCPFSYHCDGKTCSRDCRPAAEEPCGSDERCNSRGRCIPPGDCATDSDCVDTPPPECDGDILRTFSENGTCDTSGDRATCSYQASRTRCEYECSRGACQPDPCSGKTCNSPPAATCSSDGSELITYAAPGTCIAEEGGRCDYTKSTKGCPNGCENGRCKSGPCTGVSCDSPPADECDGNSAVTYEDSGECRTEQGDGTRCVYLPSFENCSYTGATCRSAQCVNPVTQTGGAVITEFMADPESRRDLDGEWIEITNVDSTALNLQGWKIRSDDDSDHRVDSRVSVAPGDRVVLAKSSDPTGDGAVSIDYEYDAITMSNDNDVIRLVRPNGDIADHVFYETGTVLSGRSRKLDPSVTASATTNDDFSNWCPSLSPGEQIGSGGDRGSPGATNGSCSSDPCMQYSCERPEGFCKNGNAVRPTEQTAKCEATRLRNPRCDYGVKTFNCTSEELCSEGYCRSVPSNVPNQGELVITEILGNPDAVSDTKGEWIEVYNTTSKQLSLFSVTLEDDESGSKHDEHLFLNANATVPADGYAIFAVETDSSKNGGVQGAYEYHGAHLKNSPSGLSIRLVRRDGTVVDESYYGEPKAGVAQQLDPSVYKQGVSNPAGNNDMASNWCEAQSTYGSGDEGTPGADNDSCP